MLPVKRWFTKAISSGLYVPGNQEKMLSKCIMANASIIVPDLEDSVPLDEKPKARDLVKKYLKTIRNAKG
jgi:citrate lyase subunit beta/citryl-CoA lyase